MSWQERLRSVVLAGGVLVAGCSGGDRLDTGGTGGFHSVPCGNANPDPCICDRPTGNSAAAEACSEKTTCEAAGTVWISGTGEWGSGGHCEGDGGLVDLDAAADSGSDGSARD